jgi:hypothetical protein
MSITAETASDYFNGHPAAATWAGVDDERKTAVIAHARRVLARALGRTIDDNEDAYEEGDETRDEYAVYEQALYLVENNLVANTEGSAPAFVAQTPTGKEGRKPDRWGIAPEALRWLGVRGTGVVVVNG